MFTFPAAAGDAVTVDAGVPVVAGADVEAGTLAAGLVEAAAGCPPEWDSLGRMSQ
jgi:hypothetical protein